MSKSSATDPVLHFAAYRLDLTRQQLWRGSESVELRPKTWEVLIYLVQRPGMLVSTEDLLDALWPQTDVTPKALTNRIVELRRELGDDLDKPQIIQTVHRRGYRFVAEIHEEAESPAPTVVAKASAMALAPAPTAVPPARFVGRVHELAQLSDLLARATGGRRELAWISGDPGQGKTALVNVLAAQAEAAGWRLGRGQCTEQSGEREPFGPLLNLLAELVAAPDGRERVLPLLRSYAPCWLVQMPWLLEPGELPALRHSLIGAGTGRMLRECCALLEALSQAQPLLLVLEDLHWADAATADLLVYLAQGRSPARLALVATLRPEDAILSEHPVLAAARRLRSQGLLHTLPLQPLTADEVITYVQQRVRDADLARLLAPRVQPLTGGNPLYLAAVLDHLVDRGSLVCENGHWTLTVAPDQLNLTLPEHLRALIAERFARLDASALRLLEAASVIGMQFSMPLLSEALGQDSLSLEQACNALVQQGLFLQALPPTHWPDGQMVSRFAFHHDVYRHALYEGLSPGQRRHWHGAIAQRLQQDYGPRAAEVAGPLASAYARAGMPERAVSVLQMAAAVASERFAHDEAIEALETALGQLAMLPESAHRASMEVTLNLTLHSIYSASRGQAVPRALAALDSAVAASAHSNRALDKLRAGLASCLRYCVVGQPERARSLGQWVVPMAHEVHPSRAALAHTYAGIADLAAGHLLDARAQFEAALALRPEPGVPMFLDVHTFAQNSLARSLLYLGKTEACLAALEGTEARTRQVSVPFDLVLTLAWLADSHRVLGHRERARALYTEVLSLSEQHAVMGFEHPARLGLQALRSPAERDLPEMRAMVEQMLAAGERWGELTWLMWVAEAERSQGHVEAGWVTLNRALTALDTGPLFASQALLMKAEWLAEDDGHEALHFKQGNTATAPVAPYVEASFEAALALARKQENQLMVQRCLASRRRFLGVQ